MQNRLLGRVVIFVFATVFAVLGLALCYQSAFAADLALHLKLDESVTSTVYADSSGNGNNGTYLALYQPTLGQTGILNGAAGLAGNGQHIRVASSATLKPTTGVTVEAWVKPDFSAGNENYRVIVNKRNDYELGINKNGKIQAGITNASGVRKLVQSASGLVKTNTWNQVVMTYDGSLITVYLNGYVVASDSFSGAIRTDDALVLIGQFQGHFYFSGLMDEVKIYDGALSAQEINNDWSSINVLRAHYKLNDLVSSTSYADSSGNGNHGVCMVGYCPGLGYVGIAGTVANFNGNGEHVRVASSASLKVQTAVTVEALIKPDFSAGSDNYQIIANKRNDYELGVFKNGKIQAGITNVSGVRKLVQSSSAPVVANSWNYVVMTYDGVNINIYNNGLLVATDSFSGAIRTDDVLLLIGQFQGNYYYDGLMSDVKIWGKALSANEVMVNYNNLNILAPELNASADTSFVGGTAIPNSSDEKIGQFIFTAGGAENMILNKVEVNFDPGLSGALASNNYQNLSLWVGAIKLASNSSVNNSTNTLTLSSPLIIGANSSVPLEFKADILPGASGTLTTNLSSFEGVGQNTNFVVTGGSVLGQTIFANSDIYLVVSAVNDATTLSSILNPSATAVQLGKWKLEAHNESVILSKITFQLRDDSYADDTNASNFGTLYLYDASDMTTALASASYVSGAGNGYVRFQGFSVNLLSGGYKTLVLKGTINGGTTLEAASINAWTVRSDDSNDITALGFNSGNYLTYDDIGANSNTTGSESRFATSTYYLFHNSSPEIANYSLGSSLAISSSANLFRFGVTNNGDREMKLATITINVSATGLTGDGTATGTIGSWKLYEANSSGQPRILLASNNQCRLQGGVGGTGCYVDASAGGSLDVVFGPDLSDTDNWTEEYLLVGYGYERIFILVADTTQIVNGKTIGAVVTTAKIDGGMGFSAGNTVFENNWADGNLTYYYKQSVGGNYQGPYIASDSYDVIGDSLAFTL